SDGGGAWTVARFRRTNIPHAPRRRNNGNHGWAIGTRGNLCAVRTAAIRAALWRAAALGERILLAITCKNFARGFDLGNSHQDFCAVRDFRMRGKWKWIRKSRRRRFNAGALQ